MNNRVAKLLLAALVALAIPALSFAGAQGEGSATGPIKIGVAGPHTGDLASYGIPSVKAAELVVKMWNDNGGVLGRQIELVVEDDVCKAEVASNVAAKLIGAGPPFTVQHGVPPPGPLLRGRAFNPEMLEHRKFFTLTLAA